MVVACDFPESRMDLAEGFGTEGVDDEDSFCWFCSSEGAYDDLDMGMPCKRYH